MKISHWAIIFIIIIVPFSLMCRNVINARFTTLKEEVRFNNIVDTATQDAMDEIIEIADEFGYGKNIPLNFSIINSALDRFYTTMCVNFNMPYTENAREYFSSYIPAIIFVGYDGFYVYSLEKTSDRTLKHILKPKVPYSYQDTNGNIISFTLGDDITLYVPKSPSNTKVFTGRLTSQTEAEREYKELEQFMEGLSSGEKINALAQLTDNISVILYAFDKNTSVSFDDFLWGENSKPEQDYEFDKDFNVEKDAGLFHQKRRETIINVLTAALEEEINEHNTWSDYLGVEYKFYIPTISKAEWNNTVDDVSVLAFIQGIPIGTDSYYGSFALGGSRIVQTSYIYGDTDMYYHTRYCDKVIENYTIEEGMPVEKSGTTNSITIDNIFMNRYQAATAGYYPCNTCNP